MNALIRKEARLLLPSLLLGLGTILASIVANAIEYRSLTGLFLIAGAAMSLGLALASFGREFGENTFSGLLALPMSRSRLWWTKVSVLIAALGLLYAVWWMSFEVCAKRWPLMRFTAHDTGVTPFTAALFVLTVLAGGLWTTLIFRQVAAAIWFAILVPVLLLMSAGALLDRLGSGPESLRAALITTVLLYAFGSFGFAWWLFVRIEDTPWTGGVISLPRWQSTTPPRLRESRSYQPMGALLWKELRIHQSTLVIGAVLVVIHLGVVLIRHWGAGFVRYPVLDAILGVFWGLWLVMPFLVGMTAVAEERKLGTLESQLCLPSGWQRQFFAKLLVSAILGIGMGALPPWIIEASTRLPSFSDQETFGPGSALVWLSIVSGAIVMLSFYASTIARNTLQAFGFAAVLATLAGFIASWIEWPEHVFQTILWRGAVGWAVTWPVLGFVGVGLAIANFRQVIVTRQTWIQNGVALAVALGGSMMIASALYHRAWEFLQNQDPAHGPARLPANEPMAFQGDHGLAVVRSQGQLDIFSPPYIAEHGLIRLDKVPSREWERFDLGTNWLSLHADFFETFAIRNDGTLWTSRGQPWTPTAGGLAGLTQAGNENDWRAVARDFRIPYSLLLLKSNGTLWRMQETNAPASRTRGRGELSFHQLGRETNWGRLRPFSGRVELGKTDGSIWSLADRYRRDRPESMEVEPGLVLHRQAEWEGIQWLSRTRFIGGELAVQSDGTLWRFDQGMKQLDSATNWNAVAADSYMALALKSDGSLWKFDGLNWIGSPVIQRLGQQSDWRAVASRVDGLYALSADGSIWRWDSHEYRVGGYFAVPSRIPRLIGSLFGPSRSL